MEANAVLAPMGFTVFDKSGEFDAEFGVSEFFTAEKSEESLEEIMQRAKETAREEKPEKSTPEPERVSLGREEKKGLFGRKRKKPDWEY